MIAISSVKVLMKNSSGNFYTWNNHTVCKNFFNFAQDAPILILKPKLLTNLINLSINPPSCSHLYPGINSLACK